MPRSRILAAILLVPACAAPSSDDGSASGPSTDTAPTVGGVSSEGSESPDSDDGYAPGSSSIGEVSSAPGSSEGDASSDSGVQPDPGTVWFSEPFEELGAQNMYGFGNRYPQGDDTWTTEHLATGGWGGSGGAHVSVAPCGGEGCNTSENQFNIGWSTPALADLGKPTAQLGEEVFIRWRIRFDEDHRWVGNTPAKASAKFVLFGSTGAEPNSRVILHLFNPYENGGCSLGFDYGFTDPPYTPAGEWVNPADWGLAEDSWEAPALLGHVGSFSAHVNIGWDCAPGVLVTHAGGVDLPPQHVGVAQQGGWYHLQFGLRSGVDGSARFRVWANNNDAEHPSSLREGFDLQVAGWDGGVEFGGYWGVATGNTTGFVVDDMEVGDGFDAGWYPE